MGTVFAAVHETTGERAAVKVLSPQLAMLEGFRERFEAEIDSLKILQHEGIVRLLGFGEDRGLLFYVMELVEGSSLEEELNAQRRFNWRETLSIAIQVCKALKHAHDHGVIHRDIKPANLLLTAEERIKIADFGIARLFGSSQLTSAGGVLGTADYMSPEQAEGKAVTERTDQYSLGCVMYALLAGRPPFRAKSIPEMLQLQRYAQPEPVRRYAPEAPVQLEQLIQQLLSKDPQARFPNALVLARHMEAMFKALSRPVARDEDDGEAPLGWGRAAADATAAASPEQTLDAEALPVLSPETSDSDVYNAPTLAEPIAASGVTPSPSTTQTPLVPPPPRTRFTTIDEDRAREGASAPTERWQTAVQLAALLAAVAGLVALGWRLTRPETADALYAQIVAAAESESRDEALRAASGVLDDFVTRFPDDPRRAEVDAYREQVELLRRERQLRLRARLAGGAAREPAERWYAEALKLADVDPDAALALLTSLIDLYAERPGTAGAGEAAKRSAGDEAIDGWLTLARRQRDELRARIDEAAAEQLPELRRRLAAADSLAAQEPDRAAAIWEALVTLYGDKPWAAEIVEEAQERLAAGAAQ